MVIQNQGCIDRFFGFRGGDYLPPLGLIFRKEKSGTRKVGRGLKFYLLPQEFFPLGFLITLNDLF
jgi:hypothetical protein